MNVGGSCGAAFDELAAVALDRRPLPLPIVADVEHERRLRDHPQVDAVVIENPLGIDTARRAGRSWSASTRSGRPRSVAWRPRGRDGRRSSRGRRAIAAASGGTRRPASPGRRASAPGCGWAGPGSRANRGPGFRWRPGFLRADFRRAERRRLAVGQIEHADRQPFGLELQNRPAHAQFGIVGMRGNDEDVEFCVCHGWKLCKTGISGKDVKAWEEDLLRCIF